MSMSGTQLSKFRSGWAIVIGNFGAGHYFTRIGLSDEAFSACGLKAPVRKLYGIGTWSPCRKCRRKHGSPPDVRRFVDELSGGAA